MTLELTLERDVTALWLYDVTFDLNPKGQVKGHAMTPKGCTVVLEGRNVVFNRLRTGRRRRGWWVGLPREPWRRWVMADRLDGVLQLRRR